LKIGPREVLRALKWAKSVKNLENESLFLKKCNVKTTFYTILGPNWWHINHLRSKSDLKSYRPCPNEKTWKIEHFLQILGSMSLSITYTTTVTTISIHNNAWKFWITLPKSHFTDIFWPNAIWPNTIWPKGHLTETPFDRTPFDRIAGHLAENKIYQKDRKYLEKGHLTEMTFDRKFI
jgi:hypothetical protein